MPMGGQWVGLGFGSPDCFWEDTQVATTTSPDGSFELVGVPPGSVEINAIAPEGARRVTAMVTLAPGQKLEGVVLGGTR